jgi:hypothetical protein
MAMQSEGVRHSLLPAVLLNVELTEDRSELLQSQILLWRNQDQRRQRR